MNDLIDDRIRAALTAKAEQVTEQDLRSEWAPRAREHLTPRGRRPRREWLTPLLAAAAVVAIGAATAGVVIASRSNHAQPAHPSVTTAPQPSTPAPSAATTSPAPTASTPPSPSGSTSPSAPSQSSSAPNPTQFDLGYLPLWPFASRADVLAWEQAGSAGHQPWHLDAGQTASMFTQGYLGLDKLNEVTSSRIDSEGAHIGVGYRDPNGQLHTSAVLRLVRFGPEADAPWEVVNSDDTTFSLERPPYGSTISSPVTVGGHITGVDESIRVMIRAGVMGTPLGQTCCTPAGGNNQVWSASVSFSGGTGVATIVATTGGHLQPVERFTIQGVRL